MSEASAPHTCMRTPTHTHTHTPPPNTRRVAAAPLFSDCTEASTHAYAILLVRCLKIGPLCTHASAQNGQLCTAISFLSLPADCAESAECENCMRHAQAVHMPVCSCPHVYISTSLLTHTEPPPLHSAPPFKSRLSHHTPLLCTHLCRTYSGGSQTPTGP